MHFVKGPSTRGQQKKAAFRTEWPCQSSRFSDAMAFLVHCSNHSTNREISFRNERVLSFISYFTKIVKHLVTLVDGVSDLIYSFGQDHPQSLHGQHSFKRFKIMNINNNVYGLLNKR